MPSFVFLVIAGQLQYITVHYYSAVYDAMEICFMISLYHKS